VARRYTADDAVTVGLALLAAGWALAASRCLA